MLQRSVWRTLVVLLGVGGTVWPAQSWANGELIWAKQAIEASPTINGGVAAGALDGSVVTAGRIVVKTATFGPGEPNQRVIEIFDIFGQTRCGITFRIDGN